MKCDNANGLYNTPVLTTKPAIDRGIFRLHVVGLLTIFWLLSLVFAPTAKAQTVEPLPTNVCVAAGGVPGTTNLIDILDNGTFGFEDGSTDQSPASNPYPGVVSFGNYVQYESRVDNDLNYSPVHGEYSYVANIVRARNKYQHEPVTDAVYGATGRFFISDPDDSTPEMTVTLTNLQPNMFYSYSFWAANAEPTGAENEIDVYLNGTSVYSTGPLPAVSDLAWKQHGFTFTNGASSTATVLIKSTQTGKSGNDFYLDNLEMYDCSFGSLDFGDLPSDGSTAPDGSSSTAYGEATHDVVSGIRLGSTIDIDSASLASANADGEGSDDDGVTLPIFSQGASTSINVTVNQSSANSGYLQGWIDWNGNGVFTDPGEQIATNLQSGTAGSSTISVSVSVPASAITTQTFARFRWSTTAGLDSTTAANDGEVEDYALTVQAPSPPPLAQCSATTGYFQNPDLEDYSCVSGGSNFGAAINNWDLAAGTAEAFIHDAPACYVTGSQFWGSVGTTGTSLLPYSGKVHGGLHGYGAGFGGSYSHGREIVIQNLATVLPAGLTTTMSFASASTDFSSGPAGISNYGSPGRWQVYGIRTGAAYTPPSGAARCSLETDSNVDLLGESHLVSSDDAWEGVDITFTTLAEYDRIIFSPKCGNDSYLLFDCLSMVTPGVDYGDAPSTYGSPSHLALSTIYLGSTPPDTENAHAASPNADGDDSVGDDEDGVILPLLIQGETTIISATVTGAGGYLQAWIDFNGNGAFDVGEQVATDLQDDGTGGDTTASDGTITFSVVPPLGATLVQTFARFRWSTVASLDSGMVASDGEVEDYALTIKGQDFGDAPNDMSTIDASLTSTYGDASHLIDATVFLGSLVDEEGASQNSGLLANGDDADGSDDDDGVVFPLAGTTPVLRVDQANTVTVTASVNGFLNAWIDWNQDGDWNDAGETIASNTPMIAGANALTLTPAVTAPQGATYVRFRFTSASVTTPSPIGQLPDGEVEDYRVNLMIATPIDVCSSVILNTGFEASPNPSSYIQPSEALVEGWATTPDSPSSGNSFAQRNQIEIWASGFQGTPAYEGGYFAELNATVPGMLYQDVELTPGSSYTWSFAHRARSGVDTINVMMGAPDATVSQGAFSTDTTAWKVYSGIYIVPAGQYITRFGFQAAGGGSVGNFIDAIQIPGGCDFGDAPDSYGTLKSNNGAHHVSNNLLFLGPNPGDSETDGQPSASATNDDTISTSDEDGVLVLNSLTAIERSYSVDVTVTNQTGTTAALVAWIDFDGNGTFDPDEAAIRSVPTGITGGSITLNWSAIPFDIQAGNTYLRLRLTTEAMNNQEPDGVKSDGEVEDYALTIGGTTLSGRVYIDANSNATDDSEAGIGSTVVVLHDIFTDTCRSVSTSGDGNYSFMGVLDGSYEIYQAHGETTPTPQNCGTTFANNPTGYQSTTDDILYATVAGADISGQDFGEVAGSNSPTSGNTGVGIAFNPNHQSGVLPGNVAFYAHVFTTEAEGAVRFTSTGSGNITAGWTHTIYRDSDCNGVLDGAEGNTPIEGINLGVAVGSRLCLINKVFAPANVPAQDQYQVTTAATFSFAGSTVAPSVLEVTNLTIAGQNSSPSGSTPPVGASRLVLRKTVENLTQPGAETDTSNQASPGDFLKYRLYYRNTGTGPITSLQVDDVVPSYTGLVNGSNVCEVTPPGMTCTPNLNIDELSWDFTGSLVGGAEGHVSYEVMVDN